MAVWRQLIWKELREQVWKMAAVAAIALSVTAYLFFTDRGGVFNEVRFALFCAIPGAFFIATGVAAGERAAGSLDFLRSLPVARWKWGLVRLTAGAVASLVPIAAVALFVALSAWKMGDATMTLTRLGERTALSAVLCLSAYLWTAAAGVNRTSELRAGLAALCVFVGWLAAGVMLNNLSQFSFPLLKRAFEIFFLFSPAGMMAFPDPNISSAPQYAAWQVWIPQFLSLACVAWYTVRRFGRLTDADNRSPTSAVRSGLPGVLRAGRRSPLAAIAWKEFREARPVCLTGLVVILGLLLTSIIGLSREGIADTFAHSTGVICIFGAVLALVLGAGGPAVDLTPGVWQFLRSRPISPAAWFWTKYLTGAAILLLSVDGTVASIDLALGGPARLWRDAYWWYGLAIHLFAYSVAMALVCQLRQPTYAGILALAALVAVAVLGDYPDNQPLLPWLSLSRLMRSCPKFTEPDSAVRAWLAAMYLPIAGTLVGASALSAVLALFAIRRRSI